MKKVILFLVIGISYAVNSNCFAADPVPAPSAAALAPAPVPTATVKQKKPLISEQQQSQPEAKTIFFFKKELNLTDEQENKIKAMLFDAQQKSGPSRTKLEKLSIELNQMIKDEVEIAKIKKKLEEITKIQIDSLCIDIANSRSLKGILSPEQFKKWGEIKERENKK